jgi:hypothetical protein
LENIDELPPIKKKKSHSNKTLIANNQIRKSFSQKKFLHEKNITNHKQNIKFDQTISNPVYSKIINTNSNLM